MGRAESGYFFGKAVGASAFSKGFLFEAFRLVEKLRDLLLGLVISSRCRELETTTYVCIARGNKMSHQIPLKGLGFVFIKTRGTPQL